MTEQELKRFIISFINKKETENKDIIKYSYYELRVKAGLSENEINELLRISRDYFQNKNYNVYFTNAEYYYKGKKKTVETNDYLIAIKS